MKRRVFAVLLLIASLKGEAIESQLAWFSHTISGKAEPTVLPVTEETSEGRAQAGTTNAQNEKNRLALKKLQEGNRNFVRKHPSSVFEASTSSQAPFAVILSCADSRVPPELIFNQGIGDLFVVRVAGNIASPAIIDSIVFAAEALKSSLVVVLGHQNCGAVKAVLNLNPGTFGLSNIVPYIQGAVERSVNMAGDPLVNAIKENILEQVHFLKLQPTLSRLVQSGRLSIVGAYYHLERGEVEFLGPTIPF